MVAAAALPSVVFVGHLTSSEAAQQMGVTSGYVRRLVAMGALPQPLRVQGSDTSWHRETDISEYVRSHPRVGAKRRIEQSA